MKVEKTQIKLKKIKKNNAYKIVITINVEKYVPDAPSEKTFPNVPNGFMMDEKNVLINAVKSNPPFTVAIYVL